MHKMSFYSTDTNIYSHIRCTLRSFLGTHCWWRFCILSDASIVIGKVYLWLLKDSCLIPYSLLECSSTWSPSVKDTPAPWTIILLVCLVFESLLFSIFTLIMFGVQVQAIWNDETGIEQLKKDKKLSKRQSWKSFRNVFGKGFSLSWLSPFTSPMMGGKVLDPLSPYRYV